MEGEWKKEKTGQAVGSHGQRRGWHRERPRAGRGTGRFSGALRASCGDGSALSNGSCDTGAERTTTHRSSEPGFHDKPCTRQGSSTGGAMLSPSLRKASATAGHPAPRNAPAAPAKLKSPNSWLPGAPVE